MNDQSTMREGGDTPPPDREDLAARYRTVRAYTVRLSEPLNPEDQQIQSMADVSPTKWHLAHVTWFFETFLLAQHLRHYEPFHPQFGYLFNSYYEAVGPRHARPERGFLSRPTCEEILEYRRHVDGGMDRLFASCPAADWAAAAALIELGLHHEQQHQELLLMDIKHVFSCNPLAPAYVDSDQPARRNAVPADWVERQGGLFEIGHDGAGFAFDNEGPRHRVFMEDFRIASRPVTNREYLEFIRDGGYEQAAHWHSDGWATVNDSSWNHPLYWREDEGEYQEFTLAGLRPLDLDAPVCHVSFYEASAYASWAGARLPTEAEWGGHDPQPAGRRRDGRQSIGSRALSSRRRRRRQRRTGPDDWRRLGMDAERLLPLSRFRGGGGRCRGIQRKVHGEPDGAARRRMRHPARSCPHHLSELFLSAPALGVLRI